LLEPSQLGTCLSFERCSKASRTMAGWAPRVDRAANFVV
jgi:hypothetical protein